MANVRRSHESYDEREELTSLLARYAWTSEPRYRSARWLRSEFSAPLWLIDSATRFEINWDVQLPDGESLCSSRHSALAETLKSWLIVGTHVDATGRCLLAPLTELNVLRRTLYCIDYLLLNASAVGLVRSGLAGLSENDLKTLIATTASSRCVTTAIYQWPERLSAFLRRQILSLTPEMLAGALATHDDLVCSLPSQAERLTSLSSDEIVAARAWLAVHGKYTRRNKGRRRPVGSFLQESLYAGTLHGKTIRFPVVNELCLGGAVESSIEYPRAQVRSPHDERSMHARNRAIVATIGRLCLLREAGFPTPTVDLEALESFAAALDTKRPGRFRTLPRSVVFSALRAAVEFTIVHGTALVDSYLAVARAAASAGHTIAELSATDCIEGHLTPECRAMGVKGWTIATHPVGESSASSCNAERCDGLRKHLGLYEALRVLFGAVQVVVGLLSARRAGALRRLLASSCLDASRTRLVFENMKSGFNGMRDTIARPIPPIAVRCIDLLARIHSAPDDDSETAIPAKLFAYPRKDGSGSMTAVRHIQYNESIDYFCDWAELPLDPEGHRYYIRQHQLRRFFVMLFFWGGGFGGLDTLRWFLGHSSALHLWHYITEVVPGATIRSVAAEWVAYGLKHATREAELLAQELKLHFGTDDFSALDEEALCAHLEDLIDEGRLIIEPQFLDNEDRYRIAVVLRPKGAQ